MKKSRSAKVATTRPRVVIIRRPSLPRLKKCPDCAGSIGMVTPEEAAAVVSVDTRTIYRWVEAGTMHFIETPEGRLLICLNRLVR
ncbi:MAG: excisionase family DNA-binding protein [Pyrinomonadaceae bacterium]